ncbi:PREDICTED: uncharacterized protein LOC101386409 [Odobenus rosmarus divergens]|uniref:Uncharacterized protein LOC101386409 n=1 Tax=Odobenus rosmarus divergens TaxID=9708 RepID=A0A9B0H1T2_ODORO
MCSPLDSWAKLVPLHSSPQEPVCAGVPSSCQQASLGAGYACPVDKDTALSPDNLIWPPWNLAWRDHVCDSACTQTAGAAGLPEARGDPGVSSSPKTSLHRPVGKASHVGVERAQAVLEEAACFPQPSTSAHCPHPDQLSDEKEIGSSVPGGWSQSWQARMWGILSWHVSILLEVCTQVALNVDLGRAGGPNCQGGLLGGTHGTAQPSASPRPGPRVREARPGWESAAARAALPTHCRACM